MGGLLVVNYLTKRERSWCDSVTINQGGPLKGNTDRKKLGIGRVRTEIVLCIFSIVGVKVVY
jgi:hypothetical protein